MEGAAPGVPGGTGGACGLYESGQAQRDRAVKLDGEEERGGCEEPGGPGNTPGAQSRWALSLIPTRAGIERKPSEGRRDLLDPRECIKPQHGQRAPTGPRDRHQRPGRSETGPTTEKLMPRGAEEWPWGAINSPEP
ncbi:hypothetical protein NDU88_000928 [Pleurodeles waltl]|uniref:Uncharacterized protein n=1 Tax=Pleurodeles waltl TaxID=8319 RepID=A0AAV7UVI8_PLEWA|nr:hypothetical protein NDU88_000928 [Pleurodeles waltl]